MATPVSREEAEQFLALVRSGMSQSQAARKIGRGPSSMMPATLRLGLIPSRLPCPNDPSGVSLKQILALHKSGLSNVEISKKVGLHSSTVSDKLRRAKTEEERRHNAALSELPAGKPVSTDKMVLRENPLPLEIGSSVTWSALGMDISWEQACKMTAHLRLR